MTAANFVTIKTSDRAARLMRETADMTGEKHYRLLERLLAVEFEKRAREAKMFKKGKR